MYESDVKADVNTTVLRSVCQVTWLCLAGCMLTESVQQAPAEAVRHLVCTDVLQQHLTCMGSWPRQSRGRSFAASVLLFETMQRGLYLTSQARDAGHTDLVSKVG